MSTARDAEKEREIEASTDVKQLKTIRSSRKGQLTKLENDVKRYFRIPLKDMKKYTLDGFRTTFEKQVHFYDLAHERILDLLQATPDEYEEEERLGQDQDAQHQATRDGVMDLQAALAAFRKTTCLAKELNTLKSADALEEDYTYTQLKNMEVTVRELLEERASLANIDEICGLIQSTHLLHSSLSAEAGRRRPAMTTPVVAAGAAPPPRSNIRLPRMELSHFTGDQERWRDFWTEFTNALDKDHSLSSADKLHYLRTSIQSEEGKDIMTTASRGGKDYDAVVKMLKQRYNRPRETCRIVLQKFLDHRIEPTHEGLGKLLSMFAQTITAMQELTDNKVETLLSILMEMRLPLDPFKEWMKDTAKDNSPPSSERFIDFIQRYRRTLTPGAMESLPAASQAKKQSRVAACHFTSSQACKQCGSAEHAIYQCSTFRNLSVQNRIQTQQRLKLCYNCLGGDHHQRNCRSRFGCRICNKHHHSLLHNAEQSNSDSNDTRELIPESAGNSGTADATPRQGTNIHATTDSPCLATNNSPVGVLGTCVLKIDHHGGLHPARALIDNGSVMSFITNRFVKKLNLHKVSQPTKIQGFQRAETPAIKYRVDFGLRVPSGELKAIRALVVEDITGDIPAVSLTSIRDLPYLQGLPLADPKFDQPSTIDVLLGVDSLPTIMQDWTRFSDDRLLWANETDYGWVVSGTHQAPQSTLHTHLCLTATTDQQTQDLLISFLEAESLASVDFPEVSLTQEEERAESHFVRTHSRLPEGRFEVQLPRKENPPALGESRNQAVRRHKQNTLSLQRKGKLQEFQDALRDYASRGHAEQVPLKELSLSPPLMYYLPTHGVYKESSTTTKLRVVFDASASTTTGYSLNDQLLAGPNLYPQLVPILVNFRRYPVGMTADVGKMFREISLHPEERNYHRFLMSGESGDIEDWRMTRLTFGITSSPFLATRVLRQAASLFKEDFPEAAEVIEKQLYVDDCIAGADSEEKAILLREQLTIIFARIQMVLRKWRTNSQPVRDSIPSELREEDSIQLFTAPNEIHKTLGIHWNTMTDCLHVATPPPSTILYPTKRQVASEIARVFDILGWVAPAVLQLKLLLQRLWKLGNTWDEPVPPEIALAWCEWQSEQHLISQFPICRYFLTRGKKAISQQLHGFADASKLAYGGVVYLCTTYSDSSISTSILLAKTRVAKLSPPNTIPRLELCGALLLSHLLQTISTVLGIPTDDVYAWSDSTIALSWINSPPGGSNPYVCNRVSKIVERVPSSRWRHVPTDQNPADFTSRGLSPRQLVESELWWKGPTWLIVNPSEWPANDAWKRGAAEVSDPIALVVVEKTVTDEIIRRFSGYKRMLRVLCWCKRFAYNCQHPNGRNANSHITTEELESLEVTLLQQSQLRSFSKEVSRLQQKQELPNRSSLLD